MTFSFALANLFEILLWVTVLSSRSTRSALFGLRHDNRVIFIAIFITYVAIATLWSPGSAVDRLSEVWSWRKIALFPIAMILFQTDTIKNQYRLIFFLYCCGYLVASIIGFSLFEGRIFEKDVTRLIENHTTQGIYLCCGLMIGFTLMISRRSYFFYVLTIGYFLLFLYSWGFVLTGKSGAIFSMVSFCFLAILLNAHLKKMGKIYPRLIVLFFLTLIAGLVILIPESTIFNQAMIAYQDGVSSYSNEWVASQSSTGLRLAFWQNAIDVILLNPIFGSGSGGYSIAYESISSGKNGLLGITIDDPHNQYLLIAGEQGLLGLILFILIPISFVRGIPLSSNNLVLFALVYGISLTSLFNGHFNSFVEGRLFWGLCALELSGVKRVDFWRNSERELDEI